MNNHRHEHNFHAGVTRSTDSSEDAEAPNAAIEDKAALIFDVTVCVTSPGR